MERLSQRNLKRYKHREMYIEATSERFRGVWSYYTLIGYIDAKTQTFYSWGYRRYSSTTSKQITMLIREQNLRLVQGSREEIELKIYNIIGENK